VLIVALALVLVLVCPGMPAVMGMLISGGLSKQHQQVVAA